MTFYLVGRGGSYVHTTPETRGAFAVSDDTAAAWTRLVDGHNGHRPHDWRGRRLRPYPALDVASHAPFAPSGVYVDHRDPTVEAAAFELRDRMSGTPDQAVLQDLATQFELRHWRDAYNAVRNVGRRVTGENGRDQASGTLRWRRWSTRRWSPQGIAAVEADHGRHRAFGVELEYNHQSGGAHYEISAAARTAGLVFVERWSSYGRNMSMPGWQGTYDSTVSGGEIISDILVGDDASHEEVRTMLAIIRDNGGQAGTRQGVHVHHDARDYSLADKVRLVDNLQALAPVLQSFLPASRGPGAAWCRPLGTTEWAYERSCIAVGNHGSGSHSYAFNFGHLFGPSPRVEFRAFGHSLNGRKLRTWIRVGQAIMAATKAGTIFGHGVTCEQMLAMLRRDGGLTTWAAERFAEMVARRTGVPVAA